jgi:ribosomal protein S3AE
MLSSPSDTQTSECGLAAVSAALTDPLKAETARNSSEVHPDVETCIEDLQEDDTLHERHVTLLINDYYSDLMQSERGQMQERQHQDIVRLHRSRVVVKRVCGVCSGLVMLVVFIVLLVQWAVNK